MIEVTGSGWATISLQGDENTPSMEIHASYITDVPIDILDAAIEYYKRGTCAIFFDCEGSMATLIMNPYTVYCIYNDELFIYNNLSPKQVIDDLVADITKDKQKWIGSFLCYTDNKVELEQEFDKLLEQCRVANNFYNFYHDDDLEEHDLD